MMVIQMKGHAGVQTVRPGRDLFVRKCILSPAQRTGVSNQAFVDADSNGDYGAPISRGDQDRDIQITDTTTVLQLVLVHGICGTEQHFRDLLPALEQALMNGAAFKTDSITKIREIHCLMYDSMGCGQSPAIAEWDAANNSECAADLYAVILQNTEPNLPLVLAGHSYGPTIILEMIRRHQQKTGTALPPPIANVRGIIFLSSTVRSRHLVHVDGGHPLMRLPVMILNCLQNSMSRAFAEVSIHPKHAALKQETMHMSNSNIMSIVKAYHRHMMWATEDDLKMLVACEWPALVVHGVEDGVLDVQFGQHLHNCLSPNSRLVLIEEASHLIMLEEPGQVAEVMLDFLTSVLR